MMAALLAWPINTWLVRLGGEKTIAFLIPLWEEIVKTGFALILNTSIILTHITFGLIEGGHDLRTAGKNGVTAAIASVVSHFIFGMITAGIFSFTNNTSWGLMGSVLIHLIWNSYVMGILVKK